jgi:small subunit ribosomal protein S17
MAEQVTATVSRGRRKVREGLVVSDGMAQTVVVVVQELKPHPLYKKVVRRRTRLKAHDQENQCGVGDRVRLVETRPLSKDKRWRVAEILEKAK